MFMDILGESVALGGYIAIWKIVIFILLFGVWAWVGQWLDKDTLLVQTRQAFWNKKFEINENRHKKVNEELSKLGWKAFVIWECETINTDQLNEKIVEYFDNSVQLIQPSAL